MIEEKRSEEEVFSFVMHGWFTLCIFSLFFLLFSVILIGGGLYLVHQTSLFKSLELELEPELGT